MLIIIKFRKCIAIVLTMVYNINGDKISRSDTAMPKTANLYARIEPELKEQAESILEALGIPASNAITMFYKQIILNRGLPFDVKLPSSQPIDINTLSDEQMNAELEKGYSDVLSGNTRDADSVFTDIRKDYDI